MKFYLGTHIPDWLRRAGVPLFVSRRRLAPKKKRPRAIAPWVQDSGGFTELQMFGEWRTTGRELIAETRRNFDEVGRMEFAAPMDWMCEPAMVARTGLSVAEHQRRTTLNLLDLRLLAPSLPWFPVLQGWSEDDYERHADDYERHGIPLAAEPLVGLGSVCRRQATPEIERIAWRMSRRGLRLHGFGMKVGGLLRCIDLLASSDSLAWSFQARKCPRMEGCAHRSPKCAHCIRYAMRWRANMLEKVGAGRAEEGLFA